MKAQDLPFTQLFHGPKQFVIPIFQRTYSWDRSNCEELWDDILRVGQKDENDSHFIGSVVYIPEQETSAAVSRWLVIDGQQRITTLTLLLLSLMHHLQDNNLESPILPEQLEDDYLKNRYGKEDLQYKLLLTQTDKSTLISLFNKKEVPESASHRINENYQLFKDKLQTADLDIVLRGIQRLMVVDVRLHQGLDNPQMIFESMNSTGKALTQADLIRNFVLMGQPHDLQTRLYNEYWRPIEILFGISNYNKYFDEFVRFFLVIKTGNHRIRRNDVYQEFKTYSHKKNVEELLKDLQKYATYFCRIALKKEQDADLSQVFHDIQELGVDVCYPLLMEWYADFQDEKLNKSDFVEALRIVESYVFRRAVCEIPTNSLRQTFATFNRSVNKNQYLESIKAIFILKPSYRRFPSDEEFTQQFKQRNLYDFKRRSYWLRRFENFGRKERVPVQDYTIEHIMPQNKDLCKEWIADLGTEYERIQKQYLHTLGNLTLTGYNSEYSDKPFLEKRNMEGGFKDSPLRLNKGLSQYDSWNENTIQERAELLASEAMKVWPIPTLSHDVLDRYNDAGKAKPKDTEYSISDHQHLQGGLTLELFNSLRQQLLSLDECVREEFWKHYVAYKAETNFVDIVPQAKQLRISFNMKFNQIDDPRNLCLDVSEKGRLGNGDVEFHLTNHGGIPYVLMLASQALELQLGNDELED
jgi:uncharacterized protein with ParB-like and HNH nuclease domain/predicted transport protein